MPFIQFKDEKQEEIVSWFACKPEPSSEPFLGEVDSSDPRYKKYYESFPELMKIGMPIPGAS